MAVERWDADEARVRDGACECFDVGCGNELVAVRCNEGGGHGDGRGVDAVEVDGLRQATVGGGAHACAVLFAHVVQIGLGARAGAAVLDGGWRGEALGEFLAAYGR